VWGFSATHVYVFWLVDVILAVFAPAFPLSFHDRKFARRPPKSHSLGCYQTCKKKDRRRRILGYYMTFDIENFQQEERNTERQKEIQN